MYFVSFLPTEMTSVAEIFVIESKDPHIFDILAENGLTIYINESGHQQSWYWPNCPGFFLSRHQIFNSNMATLLLCQREDIFFQDDTMYYLFAGYNITNKGLLTVEVVN